MWVKGSPHFKALPGASVLVRKEWQGLTATYGSVEEHHTFLAIGAMKVAFR